MVTDGRTGLLVEPNNPQSLAAAVRLAIEDDDLREQLAAAAQAWVFPRYDATTLCAAMKQYYLAILRDCAESQ